MEVSLHLAELLESLIPVSILVILGARVVELASASAQHPRPTLVILSTMNLLVVWTVVN